jgi:hypothetical protein
LGTPASRLGQLGSQYRKLLFAGVGQLRKQVALTQRGAGQPSDSRLLLQCRHGNLESRDLADADTQLAGPFGRDV